jgi:hypothetical protein
MASVPVLYDKAFCIGKRYLLSLPGDRRQRFYFQHWTPLFWTSDWLWYKPWLAVAHKIVWTKYRHVIFFHDVPILSIYFSSANSSCCFSYGKGKAFLDPQNIGIFMSVSDEIIGKGVDRPDGMKNLSPSEIVDRVGWQGLFMIFLLLALFSGTCWNEVVKTIRSGAGSYSSLWQRWNTRWSKRSTPVHEILFVLAIAIWQNQPSLVKFYGADFPYSARCNRFLVDCRYMSIPLLEGGAFLRYNSKRYVDDAEVSCVLVTVPCVVDGFLLFSRSRMA